MMVFKRLLRKTANRIQKHTFIYHLPLQVTQARFSQTTIPESLGTSKYPGTQCCIMSMTALITAQQVAPQDWTKDTLDHVISTGDKLHTSWILFTGRVTSAETRVAVEELPESCISQGQCFKIKQGTILFGTLDMTSKTATEFKLKTFDEALKYCLSRRFDGALLTVGDKTMAVLACKGYLYLCDSHGYDSLGKPCPKGEALLAKFVNREHFAYYITNRETSSAMFNLVPLTIIAQKV